MPEAADGVFSGGEKLLVQLYLWVATLTSLAAAAYVAHRAWSLDRLARAEAEAEAEAEADDGERAPDNGAPAGLTPSTPPRVGATADNSGMPAEPRAAAEEVTGPAAVRLTTPDYRAAGDDVGDAPSPGLSALELRRSPRTALPPTPTAPLGGRTPSTECKTLALELFDRGCDEARAGRHAEAEALFTSALVQLPTLREARRRLRMLRETPQPVATATPGIEESTPAQRPPRGQPPPLPPLPLLNAEQRRPIVDPDNVGGQSTSPTRPSASPSPDELDATFERLSSPQRQRTEQRGSRSPTRSASSPDERLVARLADGQCSSPPPALPFCRAVVLPFWR